MAKGDGDLRHFEHQDCKCEGERESTATSRHATARRFSLTSHANGADRDHAERRLQIEHDR